MVMSRADVYRITLANTKGSFTMAVAPCESPLLEISSFVSFRVVRGVHPRRAAARSRWPSTSSRCAHLLAWHRSYRLLCCADQGGPAT